LLEISLIGELSVATDNTPIALPKSRKARGLLAYLALTPQGASRVFLSRLLFPDAKDAKASLRWAISRLRSSLPTPSALVVKDHGVLALDPKLFRCDALELNLWLTRLEEDDSNQTWHQAVTFESAVNGMLLADLVIDESADFESWRLSIQSAVRQDQLRLLQELLQHTDDASQRVLLARRMVTVDSLNETAWATLVGALTKSGRLEEAQRTHEHAMSQLTKDGMPLLGELRDALENDQVRRYTTKTSESATKHRTTLAVLPCITLETELPAGTLPSVSEALVTAANANHSCLVLARSVSQGAVRDGLDARSAGAQIGADLVLTSVLQPVAAGFRLSMELITVATGTCLFNWQEKFKFAAAEGLSEAIVAYFSARFEIDLQLALITLAYSKPQNSLGLWDRYFQALPRIYSPQGHDPVESLELLQGVIDSEPNMGPAVCMAAWVRTTHPQFNQNPIDITITANMARRAIELCQGDTLMISLASVVIAATEGDLDTALDLVHRALTFNPYSTMGLSAKGILEHYSGNHEIALECLTRAEQAIDTEPLTFMIFSYSAMCYYMLGDSKKALVLARKACGRNPSFVIGRRALTLALVACDEIEAAKEQADILKKLDPSEYIDFYRRQSPYRIKEELDRLCDDLSMAGITNEPPVP